MTVYSAFCNTIIAFTAQYRKGYNSRTLARTEEDKDDHTDLQRSIRAQHFSGMTRI